MPETTDTPRFTYALATAWLAAGEFDKARKYSKQALEDRQASRTEGARCANRTQSETGEAAMTRGISSLPFGVLLLVVAAPELPGAGASLFRERAAELGLKFAHVNGANGRYYLPEIMGAGAALLDYDEMVTSMSCSWTGRAARRREAAPDPRASSAVPERSLRRGGRKQTLRFTEVTDRVGFGAAVTRWASRWATTITTADDV